MQVGNIKLNSTETKAKATCPQAGCEGSIAPGSSYCDLCGVPIQICSACGVANRTEAHSCRGCRTKLDLAALEEWTNYGPATTVSLARATLRPRFHLGYYWVVTSDGGVFRVSPYAVSQPKPWHLLPDNSYGLTPFALYPEDPARMQEPFLIAAGVGGLHAVSLLKPEHAKPLYAPKEGLSLIRNQTSEQYFSLAVWSKGIAFLEKSDSKQWLVLKPFEADAWREEIEDSAVQAGPVARNDVITFYTDRQQYWYEITSRKMRSARFPDEFKPFSKRPGPELANVAPGMPPLTIESSLRASRSYVLGEIGGRLHYRETRLTPDPVPERPRTLPQRAFVDAGQNGCLMINAATEVLALAAEGAQSLPSAVKLKISMPANMRGDELIGFPEGSSAPQVFHGGQGQTLSGDLEDCNEDTVMGWMIHMSGASLLLRRNRKLSVVSWGAAAASRKGTGAYAS